MSVGVQDPGGTGHRVGALFAWVVVHSAGDESLAALNGQPLAVASEGLARSLRPVVEGLAAATGKPVRLVRLAGAEVLDEVRP